MRVHITDDHDLILQGFEALLKAHDITVAGSSLNGTRLINWFANNECDVLLLDISMPGLNGIEVLKILKQKNIKVKTIVVSAYDNEAFVIEALRFGAKGFILKEEASKCVVQAINSVYNGGSYYSEAIRNVVVENQLETDYEKTIPKVLTARELDVLTLMANEYSSSEIQEELCISTSTVRTVTERIRKKLKIKTNIGLAKLVFFYLKK